VRYKQQWGVHMCVVTWLSFSVCLCTRRLTQHPKLLQTKLKPGPTTKPRDNSSYTQAHEIVIMRTQLLTIISSWACGPAVVYKRHNRKSSLNTTTLCESRNSNTGKTLKYLQQLVSQDFNFQSHQE